MKSKNPKKFKGNHYIYQLNRLPRIVHCLNFQLAVLWVAAEMGWNASQGLVEALGWLKKEGDLKAGLIDCPKGMQGL